MEYGQGYQQRARRIISMCNSDQLKTRILELMNQFQSAAGDSVGGMMHLQLVDCSEDGMEACFRCKTEQWMRNAFGTLHGGMSAAVMDQAMGFLTVAAMAEEGITATVQMQESYHYPIFPDSTILIRVRIISSSKSLRHLTGEICMEHIPDRICVSSTSVYYFSRSDHAKNTAKK